MLQNGCNSCSTTNTYQKPIVKVINPNDGFSYGACVACGVRMSEAT